MPSCPYQFSPRPKTSPESIRTWNFFHKFSRNGSHICFYDGDVEHHYICIYDITIHLQTQQVSGFCMFLEKWVTKPWKQHHCMSFLKRTWDEFEDVLGNTMVIYDIQWWHWTARRVQFWKWWEHLGSKCFVHGPFFCIVILGYPAVLDKPTEHVLLSSADLHNWPSRMRP